MISRAEHLDCALLAVVAHNDAYACLLLKGEGIADAGDSFYQFGPAYFLPQVRVALERKLLERTC